MQRVNISINLENNDILTEEIEKAIIGAVKAKTRESFYQTFETELTRIASKATEEWEKSSTWEKKESRFAREIRKQIDEKITKEIGEIEITKSDIQVEINKRLDAVEDLIAYEVAKKVGSISFEDYIFDLVEKEVQRALPQKILDLIISGIEKK